jgi:hypothetical protein
MLRPAKRKPAKYVRWNELSDHAKHEFLTTGHPSNRPTRDHIASDKPIFREDGSGYIAGYAHCFRV